MSGADRSLPADSVARRERASANWARSGRAILRLVLRPLLALLVLGTVGCFGLALRLAAGPVEVSWLVHALTPLRLGGKPGWGQLEIGRAWLGWRVFGAGHGAPVTIRLQDVAIRTGDGRIVDHVDGAGFSLATSDLMAGDLSIEEVHVAGARLHVRRRADGGFDLGLAPRSQTGPGGSSGPVLHWNRLRQVRIEDMQVTVHDLLMGQDWSLRDVSAEDRPAARAPGLPGWDDGNGIVGRFGATLRLGRQDAVLHGEGEAIPGGGDVAWHFGLDPLVPARFAGVMQALAPLQALRLPVTPRLDVFFANGPGRFMEPVRLLLSAGLGRGEVLVGPSVLRVEDGAIRLQASLPDGPAQMATLRLLQADLQLRRADGPDEAAAPAAPVLHAHGTLSLDSLEDARRIRAELVADIPRVGFDGLAEYWPLQVATGARRWIVANITAGTATNLHVETHLAGNKGWDSVVETARSGGFDARDLTLWWLRPMPPLGDMPARLTFEGPDAVLIETPHAVLPVAPVAGQAGRPHALVVSNGAMRITGLAGKDQVGTVSLNVAGGLGDLLAELSHPRLNLLSRHPVPFTDPSGRVAVDVRVVLPLEDKVKIEQVSVQADARMQDVHLGQVVAGRALDHAALAISASTDGLAVDGHGLVGSIPAALHYAMDFRDGPPEQVVEQAHVEADVTTAAVQREGLDPSDNVDGQGRLVVDYADHRSGQARVSLGLDMSRLGISTQVWSKAPGVPAQASASIGLLHGHLVSIDEIRATGPGLSVQAQATIAGGRAQRVVVGHFQVGRTSGSGRVELPTEATARGALLSPIRVTAEGPVLDLTAAIGGTRPAYRTRSATHPARPAPAATPTPWVADLAFDQVLVGRQASMSRVSAHVEDDGRRIALARLDAAGPTPVAVRLTPDPGGRQLRGTVADAGLLLSALGVTDALVGGSLRLDGRFDDRTAASLLDGRVQIGRFVVRDAPLAARIVRNLSIYGWLMALPAPQLAVERTVLPFRLQDQVVTLVDARAHSPSLGVTLRGRIDLKRQRLDLKGTVVPVWAVNQLPGRLPLVGRFLSPEKGGGVLAATLALRGPFADPEVHLNALSALAPGYLRRLLFE